MIARAALRLKSARADVSCSRGGGGGGGRDIVLPSYKAAIQHYSEFGLTRVGRTLSEERLKDVPEEFPQSAFAAVRLRLTCESPL